MLLPLVARCLETTDVCIWRMFVLCLCIVTVFLSHGVLKYIVCLCKWCDGCCVSCLYYDACSCMVTMLHSALLAVC